MSETVLQLSLHRFFSIALSPGGLGNTIHLFFFFFFLSAGAFSRMEKSLSGGSTNFVRYLPLGHRSTETALSFWLVQVALRALRAGRNNLDAAWQYLENLRQRKVRSTGGPIWPVDCYLNGRSSRLGFTVARLFRKTRTGLERRTSSVCFEHAVVFVDVAVLSLAAGSTSFSFVFVADALSSFVRSALLDGHRLSPTRTA